MRLSIKLLPPPIVLVLLVLCVSHSFTFLVMALDLNKSALACPSLYSTIRLAHLVSCIKNRLKSLIQKHDGPKGSAPGSNDRKQSIHAAKDAIKYVAQNGRHGRRLLIPLLVARPAVNLSIHLADDGNRSSLPYLGVGVQSTTVLGSTAGAALTALILVSFLILTRALPSETFRYAKMLPKTLYFYAIVSVKFRVPKILCLCIVSWI